MTCSCLDCAEYGLPKSDSAMRHGKKAARLSCARTSAGTPRRLPSDGCSSRIMPMAGRSAYLEMEQSDAGFRRPISYGEIRAADFDGLILTGGHAPGMRVYL